MGSVSHQGSHRVPSWACGNYCRPLWGPQCHCKGMEGESCWIWLCFQWEPPCVVLGKSRYSPNVCFRWVWGKGLSFLSVPKFKFEVHTRNLIFSIMSSFLRPQASSLFTLHDVPKLMYHFIQGSFFGSLIYMFKKNLQKHGNSEVPDK